MDAHDLYGLPFDRFTVERTGLAKELRKAGERDQAESVAKLRKPSLAAWAVNQLVRTQARAIEELFEAGDAVQSAQSALLSGEGDSEALRGALRRERQAVRDLVEVARGLLNSDGHELSPATLARVSETLDAAALEQEARSQVRDGCLHRELRHVGLGPVAPSDTGGEIAGGKSSRSGKSRQRGRAGGKRAASRREGARGSRAKAAPTGSRRSASTSPRPPAAGADRRALRQREAEARRAAEEAARELKAAEAERDAAAHALAAAESAVESARSRAKKADAAHQRVQNQLHSGR
jgi:hypothetical protein